jgi:hypothetical protein
LRHLTDVYASVFGPEILARHEISERFATIQEQRDGAIVDQADIHVCLKSAGFDRNALPSNLRHEGLIQ